MIKEKITKVPNHQFTNIPGMGLEPTHIAAFDFESNVSTIPPPWRESDCSDFHTKIN